MSDKLEGTEQICEYMNWSESKFKSRIPKMSKAGFIFKDRVGSPPVVKWCSFRTLMQRYCMICAQNGEEI